jgi:hypothetical protein
VADFLWIEWNLQKIDSHSLSPEEVEFAWHNREDIRKNDHPEHGSYMVSRGTCPSGRKITLVWRYNETEAADLKLVFIITAY